MNVTTVAIEMEDVNVLTTNQLTDSLDKHVYEYNYYERHLVALQEASTQLWIENKDRIKTFCRVVFILLYFAYFGYALYYRLVQLCLLSPVNNWTFCMLQLELKYTVLDG